MCEGGGQVREASEKGCDGKRGRGYSGPLAAADQGCQGKGAL